MGMGKYCLETERITQQADEQTAWARVKINSGAYAQHA